MELGTLEKLVKFLDQSLIGVIVLDTDLTIKFVNNNYEVFFLNTFGFKLLKNTSLNDILNPERDPNLQKYIAIWKDVFNGESFYDENNNFYGSVTNHNGVIVGGYSIHSGVYNKTALKKLIRIADTENAVLERANHELRTPLVSIVGSAQLLDLTIPKTKEYDQYREHIKCILRSSEHLRSMIEDFMDFSRIASKKLSLDNSGKIDVEAVISKCVDIMKPQAEQYNIRLIINKPTIRRKYIIHGDPSRFSQILINLISNGIKYNKENGKVVVEYKEIDQGNRVKIDIVDTGVGIAEEDIKNNLFKEYTRFGPKCNQVEGSGLGLALSKKLIDLMHGGIYVKSKINIGTRFSLIFRSNGSNGSSTEMMDETSETECIYIIYCDPRLVCFETLHNIFNTRFDNRVKLLPAISVEIMKKLIEQFQPRFLLVNGETSDFKKENMLNVNQLVIVIGDSDIKKIENPIEMEELLLTVEKELNFRCNHN